MLQLINIIFKIEKYKSLNIFSINLSRFKRNCVKYKLVI